MAEWTLKEMEVAKDMPGYSGGPAKVLNLTLEDANGGTQQAEMFTMASTVLPTIGEKIEGEIESSDYGPKFKKAGGRRGAGGKSPAQEKRIVRQHSQEMALQRERNLLASGGRLLNDEQLEHLIGWFEADAFGKQKQGVIAGVMTSDVPGDDAGLP